MQLSDEQVAKFQAIYKARFGKEISKQEAIEKGIKLVRLMEICYRPMTEQQQVAVMARQKELESP